MDTAERSILRARKAYDKYYAIRKSRSIKIIKHVDVQPSTQNKSSICKAVNLSGTQCRNRAVCNGLCKRHAVS